MESQHEIDLLRVSVQNAEMKNQYELEIFRVSSENDRVLRFV
jgi:hypothetical protein